MTKLGHGIFHFGTLIIILLNIGMLLGSILEPSSLRTAIGMVGGFLIGWNWNKLTGFYQRFEGDQ
jgi:hypothetical protein